MNVSHRDSYWSVFFKHMYFELLNWHLKFFCKCFPLLLFICILHGILVYVEIKYFLVKCVQFLSFFSDQSVGMCYSAIVLYIYLCKMLMW
jgi:hypothetical protein